MPRQARLSVFSQTPESCDKAYYVNLHIREIIALIPNHLSPASLLGRNNINGKDDNESEWHLHLWQKLFIFKIWIRFLLSQK
ncbi:MAG TPA: hypothetical protein PKI37_01760 [Candidatus Cloacimonas sp.]|jgi:hypothetical protein|nr:hypothetical protein [Candidatus Cloacimonas sp.]